VHHRRFDLGEIDLDGFTAGLRLGPGHRDLPGPRSADSNSRLGRDVAIQGVDQAVERRIREGDLWSLSKLSQGDGLIGIAPIRREL
jgi:hypothetical protein